MAVGKYILPDDHKERLLEEVEGLSFYVVESTELEYVIAAVDFLQKSGWISGHFCAFDYGSGRSKYCQPMKNTFNTTPIRKFQ